MMNMMSLRRKDQDRVIVTNNAKPKVELVDNEDLTLFRELHTRRNIMTSLLHPLSDEFDSSISFLHPHPNGNYKLHRLSFKKKGSSGFDFLAENDKQDYDWLRTPPATPLFPSIEMEANASLLTVKNQKEIPLNLQPLSRSIQFTGSGGNSNNNNNRSSDEASTRTSKANGSTVTSLQKQKPKPSPSPSPSTVGKAVLSTSSANNSVTNTSKTSSSRWTANAHDHENICSSKTTKTSGRAVSPNLVRSIAVISNIDKFSNETPSNLRMQHYCFPSRGAQPQPRRSLATANTTRQRRQSCSPSNSRAARKGADLPTSSTAASSKINKLQATGSTVVIGSRMVERVVNARKSAPNTLFHLPNTTVTTTNSNYSRSKNLVSRSPK